MKKRLTQSFFERKPWVVAKDLLGKVLVREWDGTLLEGIVIETEAYGGSDDAASHGFRSKTARNWPMFGEGGLSYVYFVYGMYYCFNVSVGNPGEVGGVLIRAIQLLPKMESIRGPGRVGKVFHFALKDSGLSTLSASAQIYFEDQGYTCSRIEQTPRIGIRKATEKLWRFTAVIKE